MDGQPSAPTQNLPATPAEPETLKPRVADGGSSTSAPPLAAEKRGQRTSIRSYRPSHKATLIGLGAVMIILILNAAVLTFVLKKQARNDDIFNRGQVSISSGDLNKLGINRSVIGDSGVELSVAPDAKFKGKIAVAGETNLSGPVFLNSKLTGTNATLAQLQAGKTTLNDLNVNGDGTLSTLNLRDQLVVAGATHFQGSVNMDQLLSVNNSVNIAGNLSIGGRLSVNTFSVNNVQVAGHLFTSGARPNIGPGGGALGSNGTVSNSGNDTSGIISINIGAGATGGTLANLAFRTQYSSVPKVVISPVGVGGSFYVSNISVAGFSVGINSGLSPGGYKINYIVVQ